MKKLFVLTAYAESKSGGGKGKDTQSNNQGTASFNNV